MEKLNRAAKCSILGPQNLGSGGGGPGPRGPPPWIRGCLRYLYFNNIHNFGHINCVFVFRKKGSCSSRWETHPINMAQLVALSPWQPVHKGRSITKEGLQCTFTFPEQSPIKFGENVTNKCSLHCKL